MEISKVFHPLTALPTETLAEWAAVLDLATRTPNPLRQRFDAYLAKRSGLAFQFSKATVAFVSTAKQNGLQAAANGTEYLPPTFDELKWHKVAAAELFSDAGLACSLRELCDAHTLASMEQLVALSVTTADIMGPYESNARQARLNPTELRTCFGTDAIRALQAAPFRLTPLSVIDTYAKNLGPSDFDALGLRFDREPMTTRADLLAAMKSRAPAIFSRHPLAEWQARAGLDDAYLLHAVASPLLLGSDPATRVRLTKAAIWKKN